MAIDGSYRIDDTLSREALDYRRQRDREMGQRLLGVVPTFAAADKGGPLAALQVASSFAPNNTDPVRFEAEKINLKLKLMKQLQDYETDRVKGIGEIIKATQRANDIPIEILKAMLRAHGVNPDVGGSGGSGSLDSKVAAAKASMMGSMMDLVADALADSGANPKGTAEIMDLVFQTAQSNQGNWLAAGGPLEALAQRVQANLSAGDESTAYAAINGIAQMMAFQGKNLEQILKDNSDRPLYKFLLEQFDEAGKWGDATGTKAKMIGAAMGMTQRMIDSLGSDLATSATKDGSGSPDVAASVADAIKQTKELMKDWNVADPASGGMSAMEVDNIIDKVKPPDTAMGNDQVLKLLQEIDAWKGNPALSARRQQMMSGPGFQKFKADLGLKTDEIAFKELLRRNALQVHQERQADRATLRQGTQATAPFPGPTRGAAGPMVSPSPAPPPAPPNGPQATEEAPPPAPPPPAVEDPDAAPEFVIGPDMKPYYLSSDRKTFRPATDDEMDEVQRVITETGIPESEIIQPVSKFEEVKAKYTAATTATEPAPAAPPAPSAPPPAEPVAAPATPAQPTVQHDPMFMWKNPKGVVVPGTTDLTKQPEVMTPEGDPATVRSIGVQFDDGYYLLPTVTPDGRLLSDDEAIEEFKSTGKHLGIFESQHDSDLYGWKLHKAYAKGKIPIAGKEFREKPVLPGIGAAMHDIGFTLAHPSLQAQRAVSEIRDDNIFKRDDEDKRPKKPKQVKGKRNPFTDDFDTTGLGDYTAVP